MDQSVRPIVYGHSPKRKIRFVPLKCDLCSDDAHDVPFALFLFKPNYICPYTSHDWSVASCSRES